MPNTPIEHLDYTMNEWTGPFGRFIDALEDIKVCFDIGANAGGFSKVILNKFPNARIVAVEPIKNTYEFLVKQLPDQLVYQAAIQYGTEETRMFWRGENMGAYFTEEVNAGDDKVFSGETVKCMTLEQFPMEPDIIKLDVEGAEENIIANSEIIKDTKYLIIEWHPDLVDPVSFFEQHLPNHKILFNQEFKQFLLCLR